MAYLSDIEIAQQCQMQPITEIAKKAKVERAIFNMENKNPALKLRKARLIDVERKKLGNASTSTEGEQNSRFHRGPND